MAKITTTKSASTKPATKSTSKPSGKSGSGGSSSAKPVVVRSTYKCPFDSSELNKWRLYLLERRSAISGDILDLVKDAMEAEDGHTTPNHIAERGSDADLQDLSLGVAGDEKELIWQIDRALRKIELSQPVPFGICEFTKQPIPKSRLQLIPWTPLSIEGAEQMERDGLTLEDMLVDN